MATSASNEVEESRITSETLRHLVEARAIEALVRRYADVCDEDYDPVALSNLFTEDASWTGSAELTGESLGSYVGREAIHDYFASVSSRILYAHHIVMSPQVELDAGGQSASGRWNTLVWMQLQASGSEGGGLVKLISSVYEHRYEKHNGNWLISQLSVKTRFDVRITSDGVAILGILQPRLRG